MINIPTTLVVGAGASQPFGFPTAAGVYGRIVDSSWFGEFSQGRIPADQDVIAQIFRATGTKFHETWPFAQRLAHAQFESVDAVLERHPNDPLFQRVGKALIALMIEPSLHKVTDLASPASGDWIKLLLRKMSDDADTFGRFKENKLRVVTFNFDTLIEHRLARHLAAAFNDASYAAARVYADQLVIHVHGTLEASRDSMDMDRWLASAIEQIAVVHQEVPEERLQAIRTTMQSAEIICFLGFGYHRANIAKLSLPIDSSNVGTIYGTAYGFGAGERIELKRLFQRYHTVELGEEQEDCERFLKNHHVLRA